mmetsp:Transcript_7993/g.18691  ORF Transcript_7993/g.18691 Transcript_7993/m.18691 type:complete len:274 (+) Transcript_7993:384-1205(+)
MKCRELADELAKYVVQLLSLRAALHEREVPIEHALPVDLVQIGVVEVIPKHPPRVPEHLLVLQLRPDGHRQSPDVGPVPLEFLVREELRDFLRLGLHDVYVPVDHGDHVPSVAARVRVLDRKSRRRTDLLGRVGRPVAHREEAEGVHPGTLVVLLEQDERRVVVDLGHDLDVISRGDVVETVRRPGEREAVVPRDAEADHRVHDEGTLIVLFVLVRRVGPVGARRVAGPGKEALRQLLGLQQQLELVDPLHGHLECSASPVRGGHEGVHGIVF